MGILGRAVSYSNLLAMIRFSTRIRHFHTSFLKFKFSPVFHYFSHFSPSSNNPRAIRLGIRCAILWILAIICWVNDRMFCDMWSTVNFQYFHAIWHILIFNASYPACVLFCLFHAYYDFPQKRPVLMYWPSDNCEYGVPYIYFKGLDKQEEDKKV